LADGELVCVAATLGVGVPPGAGIVFAVALGVTANATTPTISSATKTTPAAMSVRLIDLGTQK
jgi:hypothetical protein